MVGIFGAALFLFFHGYRLTDFPGLHYDEAWAANFAARIAGEAGFWPREGMSPYTSAWVHYIGAIFFKIFGVNLAVYRWSQLFLSFTGIFLLALAVKKRYGENAAALLPLAVVCLPGLYLNHRFGIELNSFHVLIFGWLMLALVTGRRWQASLAVLYGVTSHILFFAVAAALAAFLLLSRKRLKMWDRVWIVGTAVVLIPFLSQVLQRIPETNKVLLLIAAVCSVAVVFATPIFRWIETKSERVQGFLSPYRDKFGWLFFLLFIPFWFPLFVFAEGHWTVLAYKGQLQQFPLFAMGLAALGPAVYLGWKKIWAKGDGLFLCLLLIAIGAIIPKPAPRYFELPLLGLAVCVAIGWTEISQVTLRRVTQLVAVCASLILFSQQGLPGDTTEKKHKFFFLKDESGDFLAKQRVAAEWGLRGCKLSDIRMADFRGGEALRFLARGDWPMAEKNCEWPQAVLRRASQEVHAPERLWEGSGYVVER